MTDKERYEQLHKIYLDCLNDINPLDMHIVAEYTTNQNELTFFEQISNLIIKQRFDDAKKNNMLEYMFN